MAKETDEKNHRVGYEADQAVSVVSFISRSMGYK
jgi:hypothetical protein